MILPRVFKHFDVSVPDFGGGRKYRMCYFRKVFKVFRLRPILSSLCVFAETWFYQCFLMPFHVSVPDFGGGAKI